LSKEKLIWNQKKNEIQQNFDQEAEFVLKNRDATFKPKTKKYDVKKNGKRSLGGIQSNMGVSETLQYKFRRNHPELI